MSQESLFCSTALGARIEAAERDFIATAAAAAGQRTGSAAAFVRSLGGGSACYAEDGSPFNKVVGVGFDRVPDDAELTDLEQAYAATRAPVQFELSSLGAPEIPEVLTRRGYRLVGFENVLGRSLREVEVAVADIGMDVRLSTDDEFDEWVDVIADGFAHPDVEGVPSHEEFPRDIIANAERDTAAAGARRYIAVCDGVAAGAGGMRLAGTVAQLTGAATAPAHRRRGVQTALLTMRLRDAAAAGAEIAVVTTQPGSKSQQNVQGRGFQLLYTRAVLVRP